MTADLDAAERMYLAGCLFVATAQCPREERAAAIDCAEYMARKLGITAELDHVARQYMRDLARRN